jgi:predicted methyltransferase
MLRPLALPLFALASLALTASACGGGQSEPTTPAAENGTKNTATEAKLRASLDRPDRPAAEKARDPWRHPVETLSFFGLRDDMTVIELWPGGGWYTQVLAPVLAENGKLIVTNFDPNGPADYPPTKYGKRLAERLEKSPDLFGKVDVRLVHPPDDISLGPDNSADLVLTFRNFHGWLQDGIAPKILAAAFKVLKPGGVLGITEHRAKPDQDASKAGETGYVPEGTVIGMTQAAGFKLVDQSEINANPKDTKDYPAGVWTLPPTLKLGDKDRAKYEAIGESDRMTLRFVKPPVNQP